MTNGQVPPVPQKKGTSPWLLVGIGCASIVMLGVLAMGVVGYFVYDKAKDVAQEMEDDPIATTARFIAAANPEIEVVSADKNARVVVFRNTDTGEEFTFNYDDIEDGRITFSSDDETASIDFNQEGDTGSLTVTTDEGTTTFGTNDVDIPSWVPIFPGTEPTGTYASETPDARAGAFTIKTPEALEEVLGFYETELKSAGIVIQNRTTTPESAMLVASLDEGSRTVTVAFGFSGGQVEGVVNYTEKTN